MPIADFLVEFRRYREITERALAQIPDDELNTVIAPDGNSAAMLVRHLSGNLISRFTDFLTTDGEKPWRARDEEFIERAYARSEVTEMWARGWDVLEREIGALRDEDLGRQVSIRGQSLTMHEALCRSSTHVAYHAGQIVLLARMFASGEWRWISIPKGKSEEYGRQPSREKGPG